MPRLPKAGQCRDSSPSSRHALADHTVNAGVISAGMMRRFTEGGIGQPWTATRLEPGNSFAQHGICMRRVRTISILTQIWLSTCPNQRGPAQYKNTRQYWNPWMQRLRAGKLPSLVRPPIAKLGRSSKSWPARFLLPTPLCQAAVESSHLGGRGNMLGDSFILS